MAMQQPRRGYLQDLRNLYKTISLSTDGRASIAAVSNRSVDVHVTPKQGYNAHATFVVTISVPYDYPKMSPDVEIFTPIFHPNIDFRSGNVCVSILSDWNSCYSLLDVVKAILFLIENPNFDSANNNFGTLSKMENLENLTKRLLAGHRVKGLVFPPNEAWCTWATTANDCYAFIKTSDEDVAQELISIPFTTITDKLNPEFPDDKSETISDKLEVDSSLSLMHVPSVANVRYSVDSEDSYSNKPYYHYYSDSLCSQRILVQSPAQRLPTVFYFCEFIGETNHRRSLGDKYRYILSGSCQFTEPLHVMLHSQQTSFRPWFAFTISSYFSNYSSSSFSVNYSHLSLLFREPKPTKIGLTDDFFPDSSGYLLAKFFHLARIGISIKQEEDDVLESVCLYDLFMESDQPPECQTDDRDPTEVHSSVADPCEYSVLTGDDTSDIEDEDENEDREEEEEEEEEEEMEVGAGDDTDDDDGGGYDEIGFDRNYFGRTFSSCSSCQEMFKDNAEAIRSMLPFTWVFAQTRWPPVFAPQQIVDLSWRSEIKLPPWRVSVGRLFSDVFIHCEQKPDLKHLLLLDPMTLSFGSPVLNLMQVVSPNKLSSLLWLTPHGALFNSPLPQKIPTGVRLVALTALVSNWIAWFSRMEVYTSLGMSRCRSELISDAVAAVCLQPATLGCGQAPLFDAWPLWSLRLISRSLSPLLARLLVTFEGSQSTTYCFFPFSDLDEL